MANIVTLEANQILGASVAGSTYPAVVKPVNLALNISTGLGTSVAAGTEPTNTGGSTYARWDTTTTNIWGTPSGGSITNSVNVATFTNMPACTIGGIELYDTATRTTSADASLTNGSANISAADAGFTSSDVGQKVTSGTSGIPTNTTILSVTDATHAVMSANFTGTGTSGATLTIVTPVRRWFGALTANKTVNAGDTVTFATSSISITLS